MKKMWTPETWDDGFIGNRGRFIVNRSDYPRAYNGYTALRYHVVWWLETGEVHPQGTIIHHINGDPLDDRFENLALMEWGKHTTLHHTSPDLKTCARCGEKFPVQHLIKARRKSRKYCSFECRYPTHARSDIGSSAG